MPRVLKVIGIHQSILVLINQNILGYGMAAKDLQRVIGLVYSRINDIK